MTEFSGGLLCPSTSKGRNTGATTTLVTAVAGSHHLTHFHSISHFMYLLVVGISEQPRYTQHSSRLDFELV